MRATPLGEAGCRVGGRLLVFACLLSSGCAEDDWDVVARGDLSKGALEASLPAGAAIRDSTVEIVIEAATPGGCAGAGWDSITVALVTANAVLPLQRQGPVGVPCRAFAWRSRSVGPVGERVSSIRVHGPQELRFGRVSVHWGDRRPVLP